MKWTIGRKLAGGFGAGLALLILIGTISYRTMMELVENAGLRSHTHQVLENLEDLLSLVKDAETGQRGFVITGLDRYLEPYSSAIEKTPARLKEMRRLTSDNNNQQRRLDQIEPLITQKFDELRETIDKRRLPMKGFEAAAELVLTDKGKKVMDDIRRLVGEMRAEESRLLDERTAAADESVRTARFAIIAGTAGALALLSLISFLLTRGITDPLSRVAEMAARIADGNLRQERLNINSSDEVGQLAVVCGRMLEGLRDLTGQTVSVTTHLNSSAVEILASAQQQATATKEQAATVHEVSTTMQELSQSGAQVAEKAKQIAASAEATTGAANTGVKAVQDTSRTMETIREQVEEVARNVVAVSQRTQSVGEIIATVNDIAEQSNLLALNAAIEAAGAGEHGARFAVVAGEMKNLADQAKECTVQVRTILGETQKGINGSVMLTEEAVKRVESGKQQADVALQTIRELAETTQRSVQAFQQIIGAANQQQIGFEQITKGMQDIRQAAEQTAVGTGQLEKAVAGLNSLSQQLATAVGRYQV